MKKITVAKKLCIIFAIGAVFFASACKTVSIAATEGQKAVLIEHPERFFWELKRGDASVFVLGTVHVADKSFYPLEEKVLTVFDKADRLVSEIGGKEEFAELTFFTTERILKSTVTDPQKHLDRFLTADEIKTLHGRLGADVINFFVFDPWVLTLSVNTKILEQSGLKAEDGIDFYLIMRAGNRKIEALDSPETQLDILESKHNTFQERINILKDAISGLDDFEKNTAYFTEIKRLYLANDKAGFRTFFNKRLDVPASFSKEQIKNYKTAVLKNRNIEWARKFDEYLKKGGTTFIFAGAAHFFDEDSVFDIMYKKGMLLSKPKK